MFLLNPYRFGGAPYYDVVMQDSPLIFWQLDETSGATATDSSGNGRDGTYNSPYTQGVAQLLTGGVGTAVDFTSGEGRISYGGAGVGGTPPLAVEAWVKRLGDSNSAAGTESHIVSRDQISGSNANRSWQLCFADSDHPSAADKILWRGFSSSAQRFTLISPSTYGFGDVLHVVGVYAGTSAELYVNGVSVASTTLAGTNALNTTQQITVARAHAALSTGLGALNGIVDNVAIYAGLSADRILSHYNAGVVVRA